MKKFLLFALVAVVSLLASCSRSQRFQGGNRKLYDTITVYSVDKIVETSGNKESFGTETYYLVATDKGAYRIDLCNAIAFEKTKDHDWSAKVPDSLKERVNNFLCRDFYQKYNIKEDSV